MKTSLPERSLIIKDRLDRIVEQILAVRKDKIAMIILFGSYARGDFVSDEYEEKGIIYSYESDIDLLILLKKENNGRGFTLKVEDQIERRLESEGIENLEAFNEPLASLTIESIAVVNRELKKGRSFYADIKREGILLYDSREFALEKIGKLEGKERGKIAKKDFDYWFNKGDEFINCSKDVLLRHKNNFCAFFLHQATESFHHCILLVFTGYKPKLHDIKKLRKRANGYHRDLLTVFLLHTNEQRECFDLLRRAYIEARYDEDYRISEKQLEYLMKRVELLKKVTQRICLERIKKYEDN